VYTGRAKNTDGHGKKSPVVMWGQIGISLVIAVAIFSLGFGFGDGKFTFAKHNPVNASLPDKLDYNSVNDVYQAIKTNYYGKLTEQQIIDGMKKGIAESTGDPYTVYFNAKDAADFNNELQGTFSGIGAVLGQDSDKNLIVISPIDGTPAQKAGIHTQDIITAINGETTSGTSVDSAVTKIRGKKGTQVTLKVVRNKTQALSFTITRDDIKIPSVKSQILDGNIGYLQVNQFSDDTAGLAQKAAQDFKDKNVKGIVLDLRGNPGGLVDAAISLSSLWLPQGKMILQERGTQTTTDLSNGNDTLQGIPTAVLVDAGTASAAEITAGALHDNKAATIFGVKSFGKGVVQQIIPMDGGAELKVTIASWYRPDGENINHKGITPDHVIPITDSDATAGKDPQKDAALQFLNKN
jgi:carboxyl-terminal processing protease